MLLSLLVIVMLISNILVLSISAAAESGEQISDVTWYRYIDKNPDDSLKEEEKKAFLSAMDEKYNFSGSGTEDDPFLISSYDDICRLRDCVNYNVTYKNQWFKQTADIVFPDENWTPIGSLDANYSFMGVYDGNGHVIENIKCENENAGLFQNLGGEVKNLGTESGSFEFPEDSDSKKGSWLGYIPLILVTLTALAEGIALLVKKRDWKRDSVPEKEDGGSKTEGGKAYLRIASVVLTASLLAGCISIADMTLKNKQFDGVLTLQNYYAQKKGSVDVLLVGSSQMGVNLNGDTLWENYGISFYNLWGMYQPFYSSYYYIKEAIKVNCPKIVVLEVSAASYGDTEPLSQLANTLGFRHFSANRLSAVNSCADVSERAEMFLGFPEYHMRYSELTAIDFENYPWSKGLENYKGDLAIYGYSENEIATADLCGFSAIDDKQEYYLRAIIELCRENGLPLVLVKTPTYSDNNTHRHTAYNTVGLIAEEQNVPYINYNLLFDEIGFTSSDYVPDGHLNVYGARKVAEHFGQYLKDNYSEILADHRGDPEYESWNIFAHNRQNQILLYITDNPDDYINELLGGSKCVSVIEYKSGSLAPDDFSSINQKLDALNLQNRVGDECDFEQFLLGTHSVSVSKDDSACSLSIDGKTKTISEPCIILLVYDEVIDEVADVAAITPTGILHY